MKVPEIEDELFRIAKKYKYYFITCEDCKKTIRVTGLDNTQESLCYWGVPKIPQKLKEFFLEHEDHDITLEGK